MSAKKKTQKLEKDEDGTTGRTITFDPLGALTLSTASYAVRHADDMDEAWAVLMQAMVHIAIEAGVEPEAVKETVDTLWTNTEQAQDRLMLEQRKRETKGRLDA
jgi:hypothetical protein